MKYKLFALNPFNEWRFIKEYKKEWLCLRYAEKYLYGFKCKIIEVIK
jgi:hypothetical protein